MTKIKNLICFFFHIKLVPICLPAYGADFTGHIATVSGWGRLRYGGRFPTVLQEVEVPIIENGECQEMLFKQGYDKIILPSSMCAGFEEGEKDACEVRLC